MSVIGIYRQMTKVSHEDWRKSGVSLRCAATSIHKMLIWTIAGFFILWSLASAGLVAFAWRKWGQARGQLNAAGEPTDNRSFLIGQILGTVSCCALLLFFVPLRETWDQVHVYGVIMSFAAAFIALSLLPVAANRAKWLTISGCVMNAALVCVISPLFVFGGWLLD